MTIRITGGTGLLGRYLTDLLDEKQMDYTVLTRHAADNASNYFQTDYSEGSLSMCFQESDVVVHLAGSRGPKKQISDYTSELEMVQNIFEAAISKKCKQVIIASSISVYADVDTLPWSEDDALTDVPKSLYGLNKKYIEQLASYYQAHSNLDITVLRFSHLFGANEENNYMINYFMRLAYLGKPLTVMGASNVKREFLYAKDAANAIILAIKYPSASILNIKGSEALTNLEVAQAINHVFQNASQIERKDEEVLDFFTPSYMDGTRAEAEVHFVPETSFYEALKEIYQEMERRTDVPEKY